MWLHVLRQVGLYEDSVESAALFGNNYEQDPVMTLVMLLLAREADRNRSNPPFDKGERGAIAILFGL